MVRQFFPKLCILMGCTAFLYCSAPKAALLPVSTDPRIRAIEEHRLETHKKFLSDKSPLVPSDRKKFKGLNYYPVDLTYQVQAKLVRTATPAFFKMKTTRFPRNPEYSKFADLVFTLRGIECKLEVYQSADLLNKEGYEDYLFVPFTDETNGEETYEVGRYLELRIPAGDDVTIDFNLCYNPYCSYNPGYSCVIPPAVNHLPIEVKAGEKKFAENH